MGTQELVMRAADLADGDLAGALQALRRERTFDLQAAYASAVRRRSEPGHADAAAVLEAALLARRRGVLGGARWYHRPELWAATWFAVEVLRWAGYAGRWGRSAAVLALAVGALVYGTFLVLLRRLHLRAADRADVSPAAHARTDLAMSSAVVQEVVERAQAEDEPRPEALAEVALGAVSGVGAPLIAAAGLSRAERLLTASFRPSDRRRAGAVGEARQRLLTRERQRGRALPDLLGRG